MTGNYKQFMTYLSTGDIMRLKKAAKRLKTPMAQIIREAVAARMASGDPFTAGFNSGVAKCIETVQNMSVAQMRFPSGKSFAEVVKDELENQLIAEAEHETEGAT